MRSSETPCADTPGDTTSNPDTAIDIEALQVAIATGCLVQWYRYLEKQPGFDPGGHLFDSFDGDGDGTITFKEFAAAFGVQSSGK